MRKAIIVALAILLMAAVSHAGPFLRCDPQAGVEWYILIDNGELKKVAAQSDGSILTDYIKGHTYWALACVGTGNCSRSVQLSPMDATNLKVGE
jgi:hypothetical protein